MKSKERKSDAKSRMVWLNNEAIVIYQIVEVGEDTFGDLQCDFGKTGLVPEQQTKVTKNNKVSGMITAIICATV